MPAGAVAAAGFGVAHVHRTGKEIKALLQRYERPPEPPVAPEAQHAEHGQPSDSPLLADPFGPERRALLFNKTPQVRTPPLQRPSQLKDVLLSRRGKKMHFCIIFFRSFEF